MASKSRFDDAIRVTKRTHEKLERITRGDLSPSGEMSKRAQIITLAGKGASVSEIAEDVGTDKATVHRWISRFSESKLSGLLGPTKQVKLTKKEKGLLEEIMSTSQCSQSRLAKRLRIVNLADEGHNDASIAKTVGMSREWVGKWRARFIEKRLDGILAAAQLVRLTVTEEEMLSAIAKNPNSPQNQRAQIIKLANEGFNQTEVSIKLGCSRKTVGKWIRKFQVNGLLGILPTIPCSRVTDERLLEIVHRTQATPEDERSCRKLAVECSASRTVVAKAWEYFGITGQSNKEILKIIDKSLPGDRAHDIVGLYLAPDQFAFALWVSNESEDVHQISVLGTNEDRLQGSCSFLLSTKMPLTESIIDSLAISGTGKRPQKPTNNGFKDFLGCMTKSLPQNVQIHLFTNKGTVFESEELKRYLDTEQGIYNRFKVHFLSPTDSIKQLIYWDRIAAVRCFGKQGDRPKGLLTGAIQQLHQKVKATETCFTWVADQESVDDNIKQRKGTNAYLANLRACRGKAASSPSFTAQLDLS